MLRPLECARATSSLVFSTFSSIMFDGSHYSIEENVEKTKDCLLYTSGGTRMPKDDKRKELTQEEIDAQNEKFRTFFIS